MARKQHARITCGAAKIMAEVPVSDGTTALFIENWSLTEKGALDSTFRIMPLIPDVWRGNEQPAAFLRGVLGLAYTRMWGRAPKLLFLTKGDSSQGGVWEYTPWTRDAGGVNPGLTEVFRYAGSTAVHVYAQSLQQFPAQLVALGDRIVFTFGDGSGTWCWDGERVRQWGYTGIPGSPEVDGPCYDGAGASNNNGGFSNRGRIGTTDASWTDNTSAAVGGVDEGEWMYAYVNESIDGGYSATSALSGPCRMNIQMGNGSTPLESLRKRFLVKHRPSGPTEQTAAGILLRTPNLMRLSPGDFGELRFLKRFSHNQVCEWVDNIPDGELGPVWKSRMAWPSGPYFLFPFSGSLFVARTDGAPNRLWWTEQEESGPIYESIMDGHWLDVDPGSGAITGLYATVFNQGAAPVLLVGKLDCMCGVRGPYPNFEDFVIRRGAGLAGPSLIQALPDGSVMWYGSGTFWRMNEQGVVNDVGSTIRTVLSGVNISAARLGTSWVDQANGEVHFALPVTDVNTPPCREFVWDYRLNGWRLKHFINASAACVMEGTVLLAGTFLGINTVWLPGHGYPGSYSGTAPTALYRTGWCSFSEDSPGVHTPVSLEETVFTLEERSYVTTGIRSYRNWDLDTPCSSGVYMPACNPDQASDIPAYGRAVFNSSVYRTRRPVGSYQPLSADSCAVFCVEVSTSNPFAFYSIDAFGPKVDSPATRVPEGAV